MGTNLMRASREWSSRPADERYWNTDDLEQYLVPVRQSSKEIGEPDHKGNATLFLKNLKVQANGEDIQLVGPSGGIVGMTNWSFGQLCRHMEAPAEYLSGLPADLAVSCMAHGFAKHGDTPVKVLLQKTGKDGSVEARAITGPKYSRIWDLEVLRKLRPSLDEGWRVPPARPANDDPRARAATEAECFDQGKFWGSVKPGDMIAPAGVYRGDRDSFIFLVNPDRTIDDGSGNGGLMRGVFISNSEVGARAFKVQTFLLENVCGNHICWGASDLAELKLVHKGRAKTSFPHEMAARLRKYNQDGTVAEERMIQAAKQLELAPDRAALVERLYNLKSLQLPKLHIEAAFTFAEKFEWSAKSPPTTAWGFVHGLTRYSQTLANADQRHLVDIAGGKILALAT